MLLAIAIALMARTVQAELSLEEIAYATGTDKSHDDHKYVDLYSSLFEPIRHKVTNITELGIASGQSLAMWAIFFANAHVWGLDVWVQTEVRRLAKSEPRLHTFEANAYKTPPAALGLMPNTMDVIIDDALHDQESIEAALHAFWPVLRPGGYYVIEDIEWRRPSERPFLAWLWHAISWGGGDLHLLQTPLKPETTRLLHENHAFFVDTLFGHRNFTAMRKAGAGSGASTFWPWAGGRWMLDSNHHNSHVAVIQKRAEGHPARPFEMMAGTRAMKNTGSAMRVAKRLLKDARRQRSTATDK